MTISAFKSNKLILVNHRMIIIKYEFLIKIKGVIWPAFAGFWASWAPPNERSRLIGVANAGSQIGNVLNQFYIRLSMFRFALIKTLNIL